MSQTNEIVPPWVAYPTYTRGTIGWRMGSGEDHMHNFWRLAEKFTDLKSRVEYFKRHEPAPFTWADWICNVLFGERFSDDEAVTHLEKMGLSDLIASDIAYHTWLSKQNEMVWPWEWTDNPISSARHWTRYFAFWSRRTIPLRSQPDWRTWVQPGSWLMCAESLWSGDIDNMQLDDGLLSLAQMLCAGRVVPPWKLGLSISDFEDTFNEEMGFVDAFRLWGLEYFDDRFMLNAYLNENHAPEVWRTWCFNQFHAP